MDNKFSERVKELRDDRELSQGDLALEFKVTRQTVSAWEKGIQETDFDTLIKLAEFFKVSSDYILGITDF